MKMTTHTPPQIVTPDTVETRLGTLRFFDGFPDEATAQNLYDHLDFQRGVQAFLVATSGASMAGMRAALRTLGAVDGTVAIFETLMDSRSLWLTANTEVVYASTWLDLKDGPMVVESPPNTLGVVDDFWMHYVADMGNAGPDKGKGGKYLFLPPGHTGEVPHGYFVFRSATFGNWLVSRGFLVDGDPKPPVENFRKHLRVYPLARAANPPPPKFVNVSGSEHNTIHGIDFSFYEEINQVVQEEPNEAMDPETLGLLASIGIEKGKPFAPDARMRKILTEAAAVGNATTRAILFRNRDREFLIHPDGRWEVGFLGGSHEFLRNGVRHLDARTRMFYYATGITPAMAMRLPAGVGSQYAARFTDAEGKPLDGGKNYKLHLPPGIPVKDFWSLLVYDNQTRSMLQTDARFPSMGSLKEAIVINPDTSVDVYFGPTAPAGHEANWVQTVPGKGWNTILRLYGPLEPWFDRTWWPGEIECEVASGGRT